VGVLVKGFLETYVPAVPGTGGQAASTTCPPPRPGSGGSSPPRPPDPPRPLRPGSFCTGGGTQNGYNIGGHCYG